VHLGSVRLVDHRDEGALLHHAPLMLLLHLLGDQVQLQLLLLLGLLDPIVEAQTGTCGCHRLLLDMRCRR
jgi:hypothetical protein